MNGCQQTITACLRVRSWLYTYFPSVAALARMFLKQAPIVVAGLFVILVPLATGQISSIDSTQPIDLPTRWLIRFQRQLPDRSASVSSLSSTNRRGRYTANTQDWYVAVCDAKSFIIGNAASNITGSLDADWTTNRSFRYVTGFDLEQYWVLKNQTDLRFCSTKEPWDVRSLHQQESVSLPSRGPPPREFVMGLWSIVEEVLSLGIKNVELETLEWRNGEFTAATFRGQKFKGRITESGPTSKRLEYSFISMPDLKYVVVLSYERPLEVRGFPSTIRRSLVQGGEEKFDVVYRVDLFRELLARESENFSKSAPLSRCLTNGATMLYTNNTRIRLVGDGDRIRKFRIFDPRSAMDNGQRARSLLSLTVLITIGAFPLGYMLWRRFSGGKKHD
jgi:hypothetical protein